MNCRSVSGVRLYTSRWNIRQNERQMIFSPTIRDYTFDTHFVSRLYSSCVPLAHAGEFLASKKLLFFFFRRI